MRSIKQTEPIMGNPTLIKFILNFSIIYLLRLTPLIEGSTVIHQGRFRCNRSTADRILCFRQVMEKKSENTIGEYIKFFADFKNTRHWWQILNKFLTEFSKVVPVFFSNRLQATEAFIGGGGGCKGSTRRIQDLGTRWR
jgi:hypothetical protein